MFSLTMEKIVLILMHVSEAVFEVTPADLRHVTFCLCTLARLKKGIDRRIRERRGKRVERWFGVERGQRTL